MRNRSPAASTSGPAPSTPQCPAISQHLEDSIDRRDFLHRSGPASASLDLLSGCAPRYPQNSSTQAPLLPAYDAVPILQPIRAHEDRLHRITVCTRPFRAQGPRIEAERVGDQIVLHHYGHGGSGWSLSWGSATVAIETAIAATGSSLTGRQVAVIGCGAIGLTTAILLQRAGAHVTVYAKDRPSDSRSFRATGSWTPDSRIALTKAMPPGFTGLWQRMARTSWRTYQSYLALPGCPIEFTDRYFLSDATPEQAQRDRLAADPIGFAHLNDTVLDLTPRALDLPPGTHPFGTRYCRRNSQLMFNVTPLVHQLTEDILLAGGSIETREFHTPADLAQLPQKLIFHCTGYAARQLFGDTSLTPVRGQIGWLIPQPEVDYGIVAGDLNVLSRRDGIVVQLSQQGEASGFNDATEHPDRREAEEGVGQLRAIYARMKSTQRG